MVGDEINARIVNTDNGYILRRKVFDSWTGQDVVETMVFEADPDAERSHAMAEAAAELVRVLFEDYTQMKRAGGLVVRVEDVGYEGEA